VRRFEPITILDTDGTGNPFEGAEAEKIWPRAVADAAAELDSFDPAVMHGETPRGERVHPHRAWVLDRVMARRHAWFAAQAHNDLVPILNGLHDLHRDADQAVAEAGAHYADLSKNTTVNWLATHHRYVLATVRARTLLSRIADLTADLAGRELDILTPRSLGHDLVYTVFVPEAKRITLPTREQADAAKIALTVFVETSTTQFGILLATITGGYPPGFSPAADPQIPGLLDGADWPISPALVMSTNQAMTILGPTPGDPEAHTRNW
jgi:hypothetical protein